MAKPASGTALDTGHALYTSLSHVWAFLEGSGGTSADSKGTDTATLNGGSWATVGSDPVWRVATAAVNSITLGSTANLSGTADWSIAWRVKKSGQTYEGVIFGDDFGFCLCNDGSSVFNRDDNAVDNSFTGATTFTVLTDLLLTYDHAGNKMHLYQDGAEVTGSPLTPALSSSPIGITKLACGRSNSDATYSLVGDLHYVYLWAGRALTSTDAGTLDTNPYVIFSTGGGGGGITYSELERGLRGVCRGVAR